MRDEMHVRIVPMTGDHVDEVAELERICFTTPWSRNMLVEELENDCAAFLVALDDQGRVAGYAGLLVVLDEGYITNVAVRPELPPAGSGEKAPPGVPGLCPGPPPGVFDAGGPGLQLRSHRPVRQPGLPQRRPAEELLRASEGGCHHHDKGVC